VTTSNIKSPTPTPSTRGRGSGKYLIFFPAAVPYLTYAMQGGAEARLPTVQGDEAQRREGGKRRRWDCHIPGLF